MHSHYHDLWPVDKEGFFVPFDGYLNINSAYHCEAIKCAKSLSEVTSIQGIYLRGSCILKESRYKPLDIDLIVVTSSEIANCNDSIFKRSSFSEMVDVAVVTEQLFKNPNTIVRFIAETRAIPLFLRNNVTPLRYRANYDTASFLFYNSVKHLRHYLEKKEISHNLVKWYKKKVIRLLGIETLGRYPLFSRDIQDCVSLVRLYDAILYSQAVKILNNPTTDMFSELESILELYNNIIEKSIFNS
ncbi:MAG: hypothetical protein PHP00_13505 [Thiotrichaceae bacterium]|nr:hypothetical protein [Thiotrichaceae bacterium]